MWLCVQFAQVWLVRYNFKYRRQTQKALHVLEVKGPGQSSDARVVKEYVRAGAGHVVPAAHDLRPADVLLRTIQYLLTR